MESETQGGKATANARQDLLHYLQAVDLVGESFEVPEQSYS